MLTWARIKDVVVHRVLGVDDTPHRIAWGVFLGTVIAFTPTIGLQIVIYIAIASLLRANKVSGIPILFVSNPLTAVPLYWFCWKVGAVCLHGFDGAGDEADVDLSLASQGTGGNLWTDIWTADFWEGALELMLSMGGELWLGSIILGLAFGVPLYGLTRMGIRAFRRT